LKNFNLSELLAKYIQYTNVYQQKNNLTDTTTNNNNEIKILTQNKN